MKNLMLTLVLTLGFSASAATRVEVETPLKNPILIQLVQDSVANFLVFEADDISGGLNGDIANPTIVIVEKEGNEAVALHIRSEAFYMSIDHDFGDPIDEEFTTCLTRLVKQPDGLYAAESTICEYDPNAEGDDGYIDYDGWDDEDLN